MQLLATQLTHNFCAEAAERDKPTGVGTPSVLAMHPVTPGHADQHTPLNYY